MGSIASLTALGWVVNDQTGSAFKVTLVAVAGLLPLAVAGPVGGTLADRMRRRDLLAMTLALQAVFGAGVALVVQHSDDAFAALVVLSLAGGFVSSLGAPVQQAIVTELVPPQDLRNAISLNSTQWNTSRAVGPLLAGAMISAVGAVWVFWINAISFLVMVAALFLIPARPVASTTGDGFWTVLRDGMRYARASAGIRSCLTAGGIVGVLLAPPTWLIAVIAVEGFAVEEGEFGLIASSFGFGALVGAVVVLGVERFPHHRVVTVAVSALSVLIAVLGVVPESWMAALVLFCAGVAFTPGVATVVAAMQAHTDDAYRGRVMSLWLMWFGMISPVAVIVQGAIAEVSSIRVSLVVSGLVGLAGVGALVSGGRHLAIDPPPMPVDHP